MTRAAVPVPGPPAASSRAGPPGARLRTSRPAEAAASATAGEPSTATTRSPGRENDPVTRAATAVVTGPQDWPGGAQSGAGSPAQTLRGTPGPAGRAVAGTRLGHRALPGAAGKRR